MHILVDATALPADHRGVGRYLEGLLQGFSELDERELTLSVACQARDVEQLSALNPGAAVIGINPRYANRGLRLLWEQLGLPALAKRLRVDGIHSPHYTYPVLSRRRRIVTLHDATFFSDPDAHSRLKKAFFRFWISRSWASAHAITPSRATASEIERFLCAPRYEVSVAHLGVDSSLFRQPQAATVEAFRTEHTIKGEYIAFLGTIEPRKNLVELLAAHARLVSERGDDAPLLVLSGARGWDEAAIAELDRLAAEPASRVRELGYLDLHELPALLGGATLVAYPSIGEGFGLPVLEAMATGTAVLTTTRLAIPEVGGDAVLYSEPDRESLHGALIELMDNRVLRAELATRGLERAATFTWSSTAEAHLDAYGISR